MVQRLKMRSFFSVVGFFISKQKTRGTYCIAKFASVFDYAENDESDIVQDSLLIFSYVDSFKLLHCFCQSCKCLKFLKVWKKIIMLIISRGFEFLTQFAFFVPQNCRATSNFYEFIQLEKSLRFEQ